MLKSRITLLLTSLFISLALFVSSLFLVILNIEKPQAQPVDVHKSGVLKVTSSGQWYVLNNVNHTPHGLATVTQTSNYITVSYDSCLNGKYTSSVDSDDSLVLSDIMVGASVSNCSMRIYMSKDGSRINPSSVTGSGAAIWIYVLGF